MLRALDPQAFNAAFGRFMAAFGAEARQTGHLAVDGKSLRRAYTKGCAHMPPLVVTVFACDTFMSLSQAVAGTGGEARAALEALKLLSLKGATVTADALHCHRAMTKAVREAGGHYAIAVKGNQSTLAKEAAAALDQAAADPRTPARQTSEEAHGRREVRRALVVPFAPTPGPKALVGLAAVARVESWRTLNGATTHKVRTFALSRRMAPQEVLKLTRRHWAIENNLHWRLDVQMNEDQTRTRTNNGPHNLAVLRRLTLNVLHADPRPIPMSHKRLLARWNDSDLLTLLTHVR